MASRTSDYWEKRSLQLEEAQHRKAVEYYHDLEGAYNQAARDTQKDLLVLYNRLAANNNISLSEAKRILTTNELKEFRWTVDQYIKYGKENALNGAWMKELENASLKYRISRLEAMKVQMQHHAEVVMSKEVDGMTKFLSDVYTEGYYKTGHMLQTGLGVGHSFAQIDAKQVDKVLSRPWAPDGINFSERIWDNHRPQLVNDLHKGLTQMIARGQSPDKLINMISKKYGVAKSKAGTLVMTEAAYFSSKADQDSFKEMDVEEQQFCATLDSHTSDECRHMDKKVFKTADVIIGTNAPPLHCRCRSVMIPYYEGNIKGRSARNAETGKSEVIPEDLSYQEWEEKYVKGKGKDTVKPDVQPEPKTVEEKVQRIKPEFDSKRQRVKEQTAVRKDKQNQLDIVNNDIHGLENQRHDLEAERTKYNTWKNLKVDTGISGMENEVSHWQQKVDELEAKHKKYFDRPERKTPEYEAWREWKKGVDYEELFNNLVNAKQELVTSEGQLKRMLEMKSFMQGVDIDDLNKRIDKVDDAIMLKRTTAATLTDDIAKATDEITYTRTGIENDLKTAGKAVIEELDKLTLDGGDELKKLLQANADAEQAYKRAKTSAERNILHKKWVDANQKYHAFNNRMRFENADKVRGILNKFRSTGATDADDLFKTHLKSSRSKVASAVKKAYEYYPTEWVDKSAAHSSMSLKKTGRGYYSSYKLEMAISGYTDAQQFKTAIHEIGHRFEHVLDDMLSFEKHFYDRRTKGDSLQWLGRPYARDEKSRFDDFLNPYMGKDYGETAYELVSMGFELGYTDPLALLKDKDMAEFIYGILSLL